MLMMMPPYHGALLKADEQGMIEHFKAVTDACGIPIILQDAPLSGVTMTVPFMIRLAKEVPLVRYFKIEVPGTANKLRALIEAGGDAVVGPFDGEEAITLMADLDAGATGTMTSAMIPDLIKPILAAHACRRPQAGGGALCPRAADHQLREPPVRPALGQGGDEGGRRHQVARPCAIR